MLTSFTWSSFAWPPRLQLGLLVFHPASCVVLSAAHVKAAWHGQLCSMIWHLIPHPSKHRVNLHGLLRQQLIAKRRGEGNDNSSCSAFMLPLVFAAQKISGLIRSELGRTGRCTRFKEGGTVWNLSFCLLQCSEIWAVFSGDDLRPPLFGCLSTWTEQGCQYASRVVSFHQDSETISFSCVSFIKPFINFEAKQRGRILLSSAFLLLFCSHYRMTSRITCVHRSVLYNRCCPALQELVIQNKCLGRDKHCFCIPFFFVTWQRACQLEGVHRLYTWTCYQVLSWLFTKQGGFGHLIELFWVSTSSSVK